MQLAVAKQESALNPACYPETRVWGFDQDLDGFPGHLFPANPDAIEEPAFDLESFHRDVAYNGEGKNGETFVSGLLDLKRIKQCNYDDNRSGVNEGLSGTGRGQVGPKSGGCRDADRPLFQNDSNEVKPINGRMPKIVYQGEEKNAPYFPRHSLVSGEVIQAKGGE